MWFSTDNPMLGGISPDDMIGAGRVDRLLKYVGNAKEFTKPTEEDYEIAAEFKSGELICTLSVLYDISTGQVEEAIRRVMNTGGLRKCDTTEGMGNV